MTSKTQSPAAVHRSALVIDTHADTPLRFLDEAFDLGGPLRGGDLNFETIAKGNLAAEFFAIWAEPARYRGRYAHRALELIDALKRQVARHADRVELVTSAEGIRQARRKRKFAALIGIEGGHAIENSLPLLRQFYALGARYMTLTWNNSNGWADSSCDLDDPAVPHTAKGLTGFGKNVVREMNRLGMMVDISHVSDPTFWQTLAVSRAPVIASHSGARALCNSPRNLTDEMLRAVAHSGGPGSKGGVVQVNFFSAFLSQRYFDALKAMEPETERQIQAFKDKAKAADREPAQAGIAKIRRRLADRIPPPPFSALIDHIDHIATVAGVDHAGLGSDFDGVDGQLPQGLGSPAGLPRITAALMARGYSAASCRKILGGNLLRVFREGEAVANRA